MDNSTKIGTVTGTGAAINIQLGFIPDYVRVVNITDGDTIDEWFDGMDAGTSVRTTTAVATLATNGFTRYAGSATAKAGITIGSSISETDKVLYYSAIRTSSGA